MPISLTFSLNEVNHYSLLLLAWYDRITRNPWTDLGKGSGQAFGELQDCESGTSIFSSCMIQGPKYCNRSVSRIDGQKLSLIRALMDDANAGLLLGASRVAPSTASIMGLWRTPETVTVLVHPQ